MPNYTPIRPTTHLDPGDSVYLFGTLTSVAIAGSGTPGVTRSAAGVVTVTTTGAHNFVPGTQVDMAGITSVALGASSTQAAIYGFNGSFQIITVPSTTTFTYNDLGKPVDTGGGGTATSIAAEQPAAPQASLQISDQMLRSQPAAGMTFEIWFTGAPGAFEVDVQTAIEDIDIGYVTPTSSTAYKVTTVNGNQYASTDVIPVGERFQRALLVSRGNAVGIVVRANRVQ
jgi:hypothetical protein